MTEVSTTTLERWFMSLPVEERLALNKTVNKEWEECGQERVRSAIQREHILAAYLAKVEERTP